MPEANPWTHRCDVPDIDYSKVKNGSLRCDVCGATWLLNPGRGWQRNPNPGRTNTHRRK